VKGHARRTRYQSIDFEYCTARKDFEDCILHAVKCEVLSNEPDNIIHKLVGIHKEDTMAIATI